mgnify:CR=1 FL=1
MRKRLESKKVKFREQVVPRTNLLYRQDESKTKAFAANIDQLLVVVAAEPTFSESQLARALIAAADAGVPARVVLNKRDLPAFAAARERLAPYAAMGTEIVEVAFPYFAGIATVREETHDMADCRALLVQYGAITGTPALEGWRIGWQGGRRGDATEHYVLYLRNL